MVNFKSSGFDKETGEKSGKFQFDCDGRILFTRRSINITDSFSFSLYNLPFCTLFRSRAIAYITEAKTLFTWSGGPRSSGAGFFCFQALEDTKQKKHTLLDRGPPLHVNRP